MAFKARQLGLVRLLPAFVGSALHQVLHRMLRQQLAKDDAGMLYEKIVSGGASFFFFSFTQLAGRRLFFSFLK